MPDMFSNDLIEICGTPIQLSTIRDCRLGQIEYIKRPLYYERRASKWSMLFGAGIRHRVEFQAMEYYGAIIGEQRYRNAIESSESRGPLASLARTAAGIAAAFSGREQSHRIRYRIMNAAGRVFERSLDEIPALLWRKDGRTAEVYRNDELYPLLGEPIAPCVELVPALTIATTEGKYIFFGNGIHVPNPENEYARLKQAIRAVKRVSGGRFS